MGNVHMFGGYGTGHTIIHLYLFHPITPVQYSNRLTYFGEIRDHKVPSRINFWVVAAENKSLKLILFSYHDS